jgi:hypothetical protein
LQVNPLYLAFSAVFPGFMTAFLQLVRFFTFFLLFSGIFREKSSRFSTAAQNIHKVLTTQ